MTGAPDARGGKQRKQIHLGAQFRWVNSQIEFESFAHLAETAERGMFDFLFLAEGLRPDTFTVLAALATVTDRLGLIGTINTTSNEPFEVARQFATLDHLSDGRAGWNVGIDVGIDVVTSHADRYTRAEEFVTVARRFWDSWDADAVVADDSRGVYVQPDRIHPVEYHGTQFDVRGVATLPAGPQGHPIVLHAGDSPDGRDFGARHADAMITLHSELAAGQKYYADVKARAAANGRHPDRLKVFLAATVVLGDTAQQAADRARHIRMPQVTGRQQFVGTPEQVAAEIDLHVQSDACDGFILAPHRLDEFVDRVVPLLQERGSLPTDYSGFTLREHLGL